MEKLMFDNGIKEYEMPGGVLRFNPSDPNVYSRFMAAYDTIQKIEEELISSAKNLPDDRMARGKAVLDFMRDADIKVKAQLSEVFDCGNDFDLLMGGVNIMAVGRNGERVVTNLLQALLPIIQQGIGDLVDQKAEEIAKGMNLPGKTV